MSIKGFLFSLLFPRDLCCAVCGEELLSDEAGCCENCAEQLCWERIEREIEGLDGVYAAGHYRDDVRKMILRYKYSGNRYLAHLFALQMQGFPRRDAAVLVPVPIHKRRRQQRGFCQTTELGRELSRLTGLPLAEQVLRRVKYTRSQTKFDGKGRALNVKGIFEADSQCVQGKHCILLDDVASTGSTLRECTQALRSAGAETVSAWTIAT